MLPHSKVPSGALKVLGTRTALKVLGSLRGIVGVLSEKSRCYRSWDRVIISHKRGIIRQMLAFKFDNLPLIINKVVNHNQS